ncbi:hypothetical protein ACFY2T_40940 [Streptomyces sp. NPDC001260]|uniref:hypothetical protein n=1 Tax=Streptomyces sp. NPDC001260 TaxID=3364551 RepID=UPI0036D1EFC5
MQFCDRTILRLLDAAELADLLPAPTGQALLDAAYDFDDLALGDVTAVSARVVALTPAISSDLPLSAALRPVGGGQEWQVSGTWRPAPVPLVHAVLDVTVTVMTRGVVTDVTAADAEPLTGLHTEIEAAPDFDAGIDAVAAHFAETPRAALAEVLRRRGVVDLDGLRAAFGPTREASRLVLTLVSDATGPDVETAYRLTVVAQVVDNLATGLLNAVTAVAAARTGLDLLADPPARPRGATVREGRPGLVLFPAPALDDADLPFVPGSNPADDVARRSSRLSELTSRLRSSGIVPVAI